MKEKVKTRRTLRIKDLPHASRPREKLLLTGCHNLSDEELIAILLGTVSQKFNAVQVSRILLTKYPLPKLALTSLGALRNVSGIGNAKATRILAAIEVGSRIFAAPSLTKVVIRSTTDVLSQAREFIEKKQEFLVVLYLNARYELIQKEVVGQGGLNKLLLTPKEIFGHAIISPCASIIVIHNHPSGDPTPSDDDIMFTQRIQSAGEVLGISMLDHVIVSASGYFSFQENKLGA